MEKMLSSIRTMMIIIVVFSGTLHGCGNTELKEENLRLREEVVQLNNKNAKLETVVLELMDRFIAQTDVGLAPEQIGSPEQSDKKGNEPKVSNSGRLSISHARFELSHEDEDKEEVGRIVDSIMKSQLEGKVFHGTRP